MKTAVSLPDGLYEEAERAAKAMGIPRSRLFALALEEYLGQHSKEEVTEGLDRVYGPTAGVVVPGAGQLGADAALDSLRDLTRHDSW